MKNAYYFFKTRNSSEIRNEDGTLNFAEAIRRDGDVEKLAFARKYDRCLVKLILAKEISESEYKKVSRRCLETLSQCFFRPEHYLIELGLSAGICEKGKRVKFYYTVPIETWIKKRNELVDDFLPKAFCRIGNVSIAEGNLVSGDKLFDEVEMINVEKTIDECDKSYKGIMFQKIGDDGNMIFEATWENFKQYRKNKIAVETRRACKKIRSAMEKGYSVYCVKVHI